MPLLPHGSTRLCIIPHCYLLFTRKQENLFEIEGLQPGKVFKQLEFLNRMICVSIIPYLLSLLIFAQSLAHSYEVY
jgi:hypothetical protein